MFLIRLLPLANFLRAGFEQPEKCGMANSGVDYAVLRLTQKQCGFHIVESISNFEDARTSRSRGEVAHLKWGKLRTDCGRTSMIDDES
jgi:hypothetical protein